MGWYGFNAGSALTAGAVASSTISATTVASCVGVVVWSLLSLMRHRHVHTVAVLNGAIAGMAGITPASGYIQTFWAALIAVVIALAAYFSIFLLKNKLRIDDALDVSSVHGVTGIVGSLSIGFFAQNSVNPNSQDGLVYGGYTLIGSQIIGVCVAIIWSSFWTLLLAYLFRFPKFFKLTVEPEVERLGLDYYYHGDHAYHELEPKDEEDLTHQSINSEGKSADEEGFMSDAKHTIEFRI